ncbi:MAG: hypothetical protein RIE56_03235, partial [Amphiplicatus sp.]
MDLGHIGVAALYGAIGGGLGALLGALLAMPFKGSGAAKTISMVLTIACAVIGINVAEPLLSPYIGKYIGDTPEARIARADTQVDEAMAELRKEVVFSALLVREPDLEAEFKEMLATIVGDARDPSEAHRQAFAMSYKMVGDRLVHYVQRGAESDILGYFEAVIAILEYLSGTDPMFCHAYLYDTEQLASAALPALISKLGAERYRRQQEAGASVIKNAYDEIPVYDAQTAQLQLNIAGMYLFNTLGEAKIGLVTAGEKPTDIEDARAACTASAGMMSMIRGGDMPADTFR